MRTLTKFLAASALAAGLTIAASANATIYIYASANGGALIAGGADVTNSNLNGVFAPGVLGPFTINNISATGDVVLPDLLSSNSLNTDTVAAGFLDVWVVETNLAPSTLNTSFFTTLTTNKLTAGWKVTEESYFNAANTNVGGAGVLLASHLFTGLDTAAFTNAAATVNPYAISEHYHIVATGKGTANSTIDIASNLGVPEPATWGLMLVGFGGMGAMLRNRRRTAALTA